MTLLKIEINKTNKQSLHKKSKVRMICRRVREHQVSSRFRLCDTTSNVIEYVRYIMLRVMRYKHLDVVRRDEYVCDRLTRLKDYKLGNKNTLLYYIIM